MNATEQLASYLRETRLLGTSMRLLEWDQETLMPAAATPLRAEQLALLTGLLHERNTSDELGELIDRAEDGPMAREARYDYERQTKIPADLAKERSLKTALSRQAWIESRKADDFAHFQPHLEQQVELMIRWADAIGYESDPYDALVGDYEPGETVATMDELLAPLREMSADLLARILDSGVQMDGSFIRRPYPVEKQEQLGRMVAAAFGFDFDRGRLDVTAHPFCSGMFPTDVRLTTRYEEGYMADALFSTLHEAGHGMYEQGLPEDQFGNPLGDASGMAMHESQSRLWENHVGRSRACWKWLLPRLQELFPEAAGDATIADFYRANNDVRPSLIRVDADEVTYDLHIVIRYELERAMLSGDLAVADLPGAWNEKYRKLLQVEPPSDANGCLQDVHWSAGLFGYFPTYSMGNIYAAQIYEAAQHDLGDLHAMFEHGEFEPLRRWLNEKIHCHGRRHRGREMMKQATGKLPTMDAMRRYMETKFGELYGLDV